MSSVIQKAGVIVVLRGMHEPDVLLIFRAIYSDWTFPKGHCEAGESFEATAARETFEETGIAVRLIQRLPDMEYRNSRDEEIFDAMYLGTPLEESVQARPEYSADRVERVPVSRVAERLSYQNLRDYFLSVQDEIAKCYR